MSFLRLRNTHMLVAYWFSSAACFSITCFMRRVKYFSKVVKTN